MKATPACRVLALASMLVLVSGCAALASTARDVTLDDSDVYPESLSALADGTVFLGSIGKPVIYRARSASARAEPWIPLTGQGAVSSLGVLADRGTRTLWVCQVEQLAGTPRPPRRSILRSFDLRTGAPKASYPLPGAANLCNDIAIAPDGTAYISDTSNAQILRLKPGGMLETWLKDAALEGIDGLTFVKGVFYANSITQSILWRVPIRVDGSPGTPVPLLLSRPLAQPDGMRATGGRLLVAEHGAGRVSELQLHGDRANVIVISEGYISPAGIQPIGHIVWIAESKLAYQHDPRLKGQDPGVFKAYCVPLR